MTVGSVSNRATRAPQATPEAQPNTPAAQPAATPPPTSTEPAARTPASSQQSAASRHRASGEEAAARQRAEASLSTRSTSAVGPNAHKQPLKGTYHVNDYLGADGKLDADKMRTLAQTDPRAASMITNVAKNYGNLLADGTRITIAPNTGNGGEPAITMVPRSLQEQPNQKHNVQVHYHGDASRADQPSAGLQQGRPTFEQRLQDKMKGPPPTVMVLPEQPASEFGTAGKARWDNVKNTGETARNALRASGVNGLDLDAARGRGGELVVSSHSRGAHGMLSAHEKGGLEADRLELHDNLWDSSWNGRWSGGTRGAGLEDWARKHPNARVDAVISNGTESSEAVQNQARRNPSVRVIPRRDLGHDGTALTPIR
ncbi:MAG: hypothetical protein AB2A00_11090 [Myxococcota bacterium]